MMRCQGFLFKFHCLTLPLLEGVIWRAGLLRCIPLRRFTRSLLLSFCALSLLCQGMVAVAMPCDAMPVSQAEDLAHAHHPSQDDEGHHPAAHDAPATQSTSCCDGGYCSVGGCMSIVALPQNSVLPEVHGSPAGPAAPPEQIFSRALSTPYRPPASA